MLLKTINNIEKIEKRFYSEKNIVKANNENQNRIEKYKIEPLTPHSQIATI